jgi:uncharacterized RDD family membrane protein YckC
MANDQPFGGFWRRFVAYLIDAIPLTILVACTMGPAIGLPQAWETYLRNRTTANREAYLEKRNQCRNVTALLLVVYGTICEGSALQATLGKRVMRLRVTTADGDRIGWGRAFSRNCSKLLSALPLAVGFIWAAFDQRKQGWHDKIGGTLVWKYQPALFDPRTVTKRESGIE